MAGRGTKTVIGVFGTIILGTIGSLLANILWGANVKFGFKNIMAEIHTILIYRVPVWVLLIIFTTILLLVIIFKSKSFLMWHANLVLKKKKRVVQKPVNTAPGRSVQGKTAPGKTS
jgi:uncharacterized membrane protein YeaQ/YmgE (transglycosylase-associated protein family)